jgi:secG: preprotein translocase, SecG subunit
MGSAIGGGAEGMMGGKSRGKDAVLSKFTVVLGILFAVLCLVLGRYMNTF